MSKVQDHYAKEEFYRCLQCAVCTGSCPAARRGNIPEALRQGVSLMLKSGRSIPVTPRSERIRRELGLKPLGDTDIDEIGRILQDAGLDGILS